MSDTQTSSPSSKPAKSNKPRKRSTKPTSLSAASLRRNLKGSSVVWHQTVVRLTDAEYKKVVADAYAKKHPSLNAHLRACLGLPPAGRA